MINKIEALRIEPLFKGCAEKGGTDAEDGYLYPYPFLRAEMQIL